jgi:peptidoglycan-associated lipoprotein
MSFNQDCRQAENHPTSTIRQLPLLMTTPIVVSNNKKPDTGNKETDMTVLVLDNPEMLARAAIEAGLLMSATAETGARKPHRMRFHYGFNKHTLDPQDEDILRQHAAYLRQQPGVKVHIHGHTDNFGSEDYNRFLSRLRVNAVARLLMEAGVRDAQIVTSSWGSDKPLARPEDRAANRRLELEYVTQEMARAL